MNRAWSFDVYAENGVAREGHEPIVAGVGEIELEVGIPERGLAVLAVVEGDLGRGNLVIGCDEVSEPVSGGDEPCSRQLGAKCVCASPFFFGEGCEVFW